MRVPNSLLGGNTGASMLDALITGGVMFAVQLALIGFAAKADYGAYALLMSYVLMGQAILSAFFGAPLITCASRLPQERRAALLVSAVRWQLVAVLIFGCAMGLLYVVLELPFGAPLVIATTVAFAGLSIREIQRVCWTVELQPQKAVTNAIVFGCAVLLLLAIYALRQGQLTSGAAMAAIGFSALVTGTVPLFPRLKASNAAKESFRSGVLVHSKWTLPGVIVIWVQNNLYLTLVATMLTMAAAAEISAARLVAMPYLLAAGGLLRLNQVQFGHLINAGPIGAAQISAKRRVVAHLLIGTSLAAAAGAAAALGASTLLPEHYPNLLQLSALWLLFAGVVSARGVLSSLLQAEGRYKAILLANIMSLPVSLIPMVLLIERWGLPGAIIPLISAEGLFLLLLLWLSERPRVPLRTESPPTW